MVYNFSFTLISDGSNFLTPKKVYHNLKLHLMLRTSDPGQIFFASVNQNLQHLQGLNVVLYVWYISMIK